MNGNDSITPIRDALTRLNCKFNLIGIVREFSFPRKSTGSDYYAILKIVDESYRDEELSVHIFTYKLEDLPQVMSYKDYIVLHQVKIEEYDGKSYAVYNKKYSSFALFDEKSFVNFIPYQSSRGFFLQRPDMGYMTRMRHFFATFPSSGGMSEYLLSLKDITPEKDFDLVCKVLHIEEVSSNVWMLFVWDGNDTLPLSLDVNLNDEEKNPLPLHIEKTPLPWQVLCTFPCAGTVLRVTATKAHEKLGLYFNGSGKWLRIRHMRCEVQFGLWHGRLNPSSRVRYLPNNDDTVLQCMSNFKSREVGKQGRFPSWSSPPYCLTVVDDEDVPFGTLMDLLRHPEDDATVKCVVRVVAVCPPQVKDFCMPVGSGQYRMRLTLEDPTTRVHASLCDDNGMKFFGGCFSTDVLASKMEKLLGVPDKESSDSLRSPPWIECCVNLNSRGYHICRTTLVG